jgi:SAM-dependent methyltransferase
MIFRRPLHEKEFAVRAVGIPFHHHRAFGKMGQQHLRDIRVILQQISFRNPHLGPKQLLEVGQFDGALSDLNLRFFDALWNSHKREKDQRHRRAVIRDTDHILTTALEGLQPANVLDLAAGAGRHSLWLASRGWRVTAVDALPDPIPGVHYIEADLEKHQYRIAPDSWELIVCWLYWQADLLPEIAAGVRRGGVVAVAGKTEGRFATSLANYKNVFREEDFTEIASGQNESRAFFIARKKLID